MLHTFYDLINKQVHTCFTLFTILILVLRPTHQTVVKGGEYTVHLRQTEMAVVVQPTTKTGSEDFGNITQT